MKCIYLKIRILQSVMLISLACFNMHAQQPRYSISGSIVDVSDGNPLPGATLYIEKLDNGIATDKNGKFSFRDLPPGSYTITVSFMGYETKTEVIVIRNGDVRNKIFHLKSQNQKLDEVVVSAKSEARQIREQAMPVTVLPASQLTGSVSNVSDILSKTMGVTIRTQGGVGSASRLSVRGLEGKRIGFFIDESPMNDHSDFIDINDIPISMIERIEIYKGVVPAKFGGSAMGGAVNVVMKKYPPRYFDVSYTIESFNTHKATLVAKRNLPKAGIEFGGGGFYTYSDNDYIMESPYQEGLLIKRDHDRFKSVAGSISIKARKWYFDEFEIELEGISSNKQVQGVFSNIQHAHNKSMAGIVGLDLKKDNFLIEGLDLDFNTTLAATKFNYIDTSMYRYTWQMEPYIPVHPMGGETGSAPSNSTIHKKHWGTKLDLNYIINVQHAINLNMRHTCVHAHPIDTLKDYALGYKSNYDSDMNSLVAGLSYDFKSPTDRLLNSLTGKYYFYSIHTIVREAYMAYKEIPIDLDKHYWGIGDALRYHFSHEWMGKISVTYEVRTPTETELTGDGYLLAPSGDLLPERGTNVNLGAIWDKKTLNGLFQLEVNLFANHICDMIRLTRNISQTKYENFGEMRSFGVEAEVKADMFPWLYGYLNVTYQDLRDMRKYEVNSQVPNPTYGSRMPNIPYFLSNAGLEYHKANLFGMYNTNTRLFADVSFVERYFYDFEQSLFQERRIPRSLCIDIGLEQSILDGMLVLSCKLGNVTNAKLFSEFNYPLPGRTFSVRLRYIFK